MPAGNGRSSLIGFLRRPPVAAGLLLLAIGLGETVLGRTKVREYEAALREAPPIVAKDPAALFPTVSEAEERRDLARAKLSYYHLLVTAGQLLSGLGMLLLAAGILRGQRQVSMPEHVPLH